jgi:hypothetical protein
MKRVLAVLLCLSVSSIAAAQGLHGKILILHNPTDQSPPHLATVLPTFYSGDVTLLSSVPADLSQWDAIALVGDKSSRLDILLTDDQRALISYVKAGGKLYAEWAWILHGEYLTSDPRDTLWTFLGAKSEMATMAEERYGGVVGIDSEYTKGVAFEHTHTDPLQGDALEGYGIGPNLFSVLTSATFGDPYSTSWTRAMAWIPNDRSLHAVLHAPMVPEYYDAFIERTFCDYLGLCSAGIEQPTLLQDQVAIHVSMEADRNVLVITSDAPGSLDVLNIMGAAVYRGKTEAGMNRVVLPQNLSTGVYFARVQAGRSIANKAFLLSK